MAAEASACDDCVDRCYFANLILSELLTGDQNHKESRKLHQLQVTDSRSLYDAISAEMPKTTEKRTYVDVRSIQQFVDYRTIHWVPTHLQHADGLTKASKALRESFTDWLGNVTVQLVAIPEHKKNGHLSQSSTSESSRFREENTGRDKAQVT